MKCNIQDSKYTDADLVDLVQFLRKIGGAFDAPADELQAELDRRARELGDPLLETVHPAYRGSYRSQFDHSFPLVFTRNQQQQV